MNEQMNAFMARSTWLLIFSAAAQIANLFGFDLSFDMATDPDDAANAVTALFAAWAAFERITGVKKLVKPWQISSPPSRAGIMR